AHASLLSEKPLPSSKKFAQFHIVFKQHHDVAAIDDEEVRLLSARDGILRIPADTVNREKDAPCKLGLAFDLLTKHVEISHWTMVLLPLGLQQIYLMIKLKGAVNLFADDAERFSRSEIMEGKESVQYLLQLETGLLSIGAFVQCQKIALEHLKLYASLRPL